MKVDLKKSRFGRILRRLAGERKGAVMMEYVMLGVLIAAACVGAAYLLGNAFKGGMETMADAFRGPSQVVTTAQKNQGEIKQNASQADKQFNQIVPK